MRLQPPLTFVVTHSGRGGALSCRCEAGEVSLPIELAAEGDFTIWLRGAKLVRPSGNPRRLERDERHVLHDALRAWLDASDRTRWAIER